LCVHRSAQPVGYLDPVENTIIIPGLTFDRVGCRETDCGQPTAPNPAGTAQRAVILHRPRVMFRQRKGQPLPVWFVHPMTIPGTVGAEEPVIG